MSKGLCHRKEKTCAIKTRVNAGEVALLAIFVGEIVENVFNVIGEAFKINLEVVSNFTGRRKQSRERKF